MTHLKITGRNPQNHVTFQYKTSKEMAVKQVVYKIIIQQKIFKTTCNQPQPAKTSL